MNWFYSFLTPIIFFCKFCLLWIQNKYKNLQVDSYFAGYMWSLAATNGLDPQVLKELKKNVLFSEKFQICSNIFIIMQSYKKYT